VCVADGTSGGMSPAMAAETRGEVAPSHVPPWSDDAIRVLLRGVHDHVLACFADDHPPFSVRISLNESGHVTYSRVLDGEPTGAERRCVGELFDRVHVDGRANRPRVVVLHFAHGATDETITDAPEGPDAPAEESDAPPEAAADGSALARALIDAHAAAILACVGEDAVGLSAAWTADGTITVSLRGSRAGTAEEECVRAAVGTLRIEPAPGAPGSVIHAVTN
jgi:hypothetical protein